MPTTMFKANMNFFRHKCYLFTEWKFYKADLRNDANYVSCSINLEKDIVWFSLRIESDIIHLYFDGGPEQFGNYMSTVFDAKGVSIYSETGKITNINCDLLQYCTLNFSSLDTSSLVLSCVIQCNNTNVLSDITQSYSDCFLSHRVQELSLDFKKFLEQDGNDSDITINVGADSIKAHKMVLRARSEVFNNMFSHDFSETVTNSIEIEDVSLATMRKLVDYLYTGTVDKCDFEGTLELYKAADKYGVLLLRQDCACELAIQMNVDNACFMFTFACQRNDPWMKKIVEIFISNSIKSVADTESFKALTKEDQLHLMYLGVCKLSMMHVISHRGPPC